MSLVPVTTDQCGHTQRSHERGYIWRCRLEPGHKGNHVMRRVRTRGKR